MSDSPAPGRRDTPADPRRHGRRHRADRCPGILRPWPAEDGALVRVRIPGGRLSAGVLLGICEIARRYGDGELHLTTRANLQLRALPRGPDGRLPAEISDRFGRLGLLPSADHDRVRNLMLSPLSGLTGGAADLRATAARLDAGLLAESRYAGLPGRFLFLLDDGRGDLIGRESDLAAMALDERTAQLRIGRDWGPTVSVTELPAVMLGLADAFLAQRGAGPDAAWHVADLSAPLDHPAATVRAAASATARRTAPLGDGPVPGGHHRTLPGGRLSAATAEELLAPLPTDRVVVLTPWRGVLIPDPSASPSPLTTAASMRTP